jgi:hypothetical protein
MPVWDLSIVLMIAAVLVLCTVSLAAINVSLCRTARGKFAQAVGYDRYRQIALGLVALTVATFFLPVYGDEALVVILSLLLAIELDDFFNGGGPRKKRFRKWLKSRLGRLRLVASPTPSLEGV